ncbi:hypothetical protein [Paractinoplanes toevensis]|uniref:Uncharacterized protein n=1 Tax=Paractinoplanes toevensis TaxID=571911 RepID=A0A919W5Z6_9ACTN|nr:hypothetical protein [Actinoplanes toevensis]GIM92103.1 hypothetical protein Ato02nite_038960 [Actinoplanes toevensis]
MVTTDDTWHETVEPLIDAASFIVIIPLAYDGTLWEIDRIRQGGHLGKTVFFMPEPAREQPDGVVVPVEDEPFGRAGLRFQRPPPVHLNLAVEWDRARTVLADRGMHLPAYAASGAFFTMTAAGELDEVLPAPLSVLIRRERYVRAALVQLGVVTWTRIRPRDPLDLLLRCAASGRRTQEYVLMLAIVLFAAAGDRPARQAATARMAELTAGDPGLLNAELAALAHLEDDLRHSGPEWTDRFVRSGAPRTQVQSLLDLFAAAEQVPGVDRTLLGAARSALDRVVAERG